jgi:hypothetical protein
MRLVVLVCSIHRRACRLGSQTTNRIFNYRRDIPEFNSGPRYRYKPKSAFPTYAEVTYAIII